MLGKIAVIVTLMGTLLGIFGAVRAQQYGKVNRAYLYDRSRSSYVSARRDELRGTCQGLALGCIAAAIAGGALALSRRKKKASCRCARSRARWSASAPRCSSSRTTSSDPQYRRANTERGE